MKPASCAAGTCPSTSSLRPVSPDRPSKDSVAAASARALRHSLRMRLREAPLRSSVMQCSFIVGMNPVRQALEGHVAADSARALRRRRTEPPVKLGFQGAHASGHCIGDGVSTV